MRYQLGRIMKKLINNRGLTLIELIVSLGLIGIVIIPLFNMFILCQRVLSMSNNEHVIIQTAQYYMEEIKAMDEIDECLYFYNAENKTYERFITNQSDDSSVEIRIKKDFYGLHYIEIDILRDGEITSSLTGSVVLK